MKSTWYYKHLFKIRYLILPYNVNVKWQHMYLYEYKIILFHISQFEQKPRLLS